MGLLPFPVVWLKRSLHNSYLSIISKIELDIVGTAWSLVKKIRQLIFEFIFVLFSLEGCGKVAASRVYPIEKWLALC